MLEETMNAVELHAWCMSKPGAWEDFPFGDDNLVIKVDKKLFAIFGQSDGVESVNLKAEPEAVLALREKYKAVKPGYYMNKRHWNTVLLDGSIPDDELKAMVDESWRLVVKSLSGKVRSQLLD